MDSHEAYTSPERRAGRRLYDIQRGKIVVPEWERAIEVARMRHASEIGEFVLKQEPHVRPLATISEAVVQGEGWQLLGLSVSKEFSLVGRVFLVGDRIEHSIAFVKTSDVAIHPDEHDPITGRPPVWMLAEQERIRSRKKILLLLTAAAGLLIAGETATYFIGNAKPSSKTESAPETPKSRESLDVRQARRALDDVCHVLRSSYPTYGDDAPWIRMMAPAPSADLSDPGLVLKYFYNAERELVGRLTMYKKILERPTKPDGDRHDKDMRSIAMQDIETVEPCLARVRSMIERFEKLRQKNTPLPPNTTLPQHPYAEFLVLGEKAVFAEMTDSKTRGDKEDNDVNGAIYTYRVLFPATDSKKVNSTEVLQALQSVVIAYHGKKIGEDIIEGKTHSLGMSWHHANANSITISISRLTPIK